MGIEIATSEEVREIKEMLLGLRFQLENVASMVDSLRREQTSEWLTVREASAQLKLSPDTVRRKVRAGFFDTRRHGKNILIHRDSIL